MYTKIDGAFLQDAYHYALAMQGNQDSTFQCSTLMQQLASATHLHLLIDKLEGTVTDYENWVRVQPSAGDRYETVEALYSAGKTAHDFICLVAREMGIDPVSGDKLPAIHIHNFTQQHMRLQGWSLVGTTTDETAAREIHRDYADRGIDLSFTKGSNSTIIYWKK